MCPEGYGLASQTAAGTGENGQDEPRQGDGGRAWAAARTDHTRCPPSSGILGIGPIDPNSAPPVTGGALGVPKRSFACCLCHSAEAGSH